MARLRDDLAALAGTAPLRDAADARAGTDRRTLRRVSGLVRRGEAAQTPEDARLAVALARDRRRAEERGRGAELLIAAVVGVVLGTIAAVSLAGGRPLAGATVAVIAAVVVAQQVTAWRRRGRADRAEQRNRALLEHQGVPCGPARSDVVEVTGARSVLLLPALALAYAAPFSLAAAVVSDAPAGEAVAMGIAFGVVTTVAAATWGAQLNRKAARRVS